MNHVALPTSFIERILNTHAEKGQIWLAELAHTLSLIEKKYQLNLLYTGQALSYNLIVHAKTRDNNKVIVKLFPSIAEQQREALALTMLRSPVVISLLDSEPCVGAIILQQCEPGQPIAKLPNETQATQIAAKIIQKMPIIKPKHMSFPTTQEWFEALDDAPILPKEFDPYHIDKAREIAQSLHQNANDSRLLHGDLHHYNILSHKHDRWLAIDPKGVIGPPEYECGAWLRNPIPAIARSTQLSKILMHRIKIFSKQLNYRQQTIIDWAYAQAILASVWSISDASDNWKDFYRCASALSSQIG